MPVGIKWTAFEDTIFINFYGKIPMLGLCKLMNKTKKSLIRRAQRLHIKYYRQYMWIPKEKICTICKTVKPIDYFTKDKNTIDGRKQRCKECINYWHRKRYAKVGYSKYIIKLKKLRAKKYPMKMRAKEIRGSIISRKKEGIHVDESITSSYVYELLIATPNCPCCGIVLDCNFYYNGRKNNIPSVDRFDSSKGYTKDNINIICWKCNHIKNDSTSTELRMVADWIDKRASKVNCTPISQVTTEYPTFRR